MKKKILFVCMLLVFAFMLCMGVMAQEATTYYLYDDEAAIPEGENNISVSELYWQSEAETGLFANLKDGDNITFVLMENISYIPVGTVTNDPTVSNCMKIDAAATVTVKFNGYSWWFTSNDGYDAFYIHNAGATLNLIGNKAKNPDGTIKKVGTGYTSAEIDNSIDVYSDFVVVYAGGGTLHCENLAASCNEEIIYQKDAFMNGLVNVELVDCSFRTKTNMYTISLGGKGGSNNNLRIDGGLYGSICLHNLLDNSYIKNATVMQTGQGNALYIDSWKDRNAYNFPIENSVIDGRYWAEGDGNVIVGKNSSFGIIYLRGDGSGGAYAELTDCTYTSVDFTGNKGTGRLTVYTSPDCENAGTKTVYDINNTAGIADESYAAPALGHKLDETNITGVIYESYLAKGIYTSNCAVCNAENVREETGTAPALFACLGYSAQSYGDGGILVGFGINSKAISEYTDITGKDFKFGLFAGRDTKLGENDAVNINGEALSGIASIDYTERDFDIVEIKVVGFVTVDHKNANLALGLFVINGESISYIQPTKPNDGEKYSYVSYNGLIDG